MALMVFKLKMIFLNVEGVCKRLPPSSGITAGDQPASNIAFYQIQFFSQSGVQIFFRPSGDLNSERLRPKSDALSTMLPETGTNFLNV